jgi:hypothetical protein
VFIKSSAKFGDKGFKFGAILRNDAQASSQSATALSTEPYVFPCRFQLAEMFAVADATDTGFSSQWPERGDTQVSVSVNALHLETVRSNGLLES